MKNKIVLLSLTLSFFIMFQFSLISQDFGPNPINSYPKKLLNEQVKNSAKDSLYLWQEKVSLQLNDVVVQPKDHIFFKAYVLTGPEQLRVSASNVLKVELLDKDGKLIKYQHHKVSDGESSGSFEVPRQVRPGEYYLRAYTKWMLNYGPDKFATHPIKVAKSNDLAHSTIGDQNELELFPEGGELISGLTNKLAITGFSQLQGQTKIVDENGIEVANVTRYGQDFGTAIFKPKRDSKYSITDASARRFPLPEVQAVGYSLMSNNIGDGDSHVRIEVSPELSNEKIYLKGTSNGITYFEKEIEFKSGLGVEVDIPKKGIPNGILELSLVDDFDQLWAKRPVLIENNDFVITMEALDSSADGKAFKIRVTDEEGQPVETNLSLGANAFENSENHAMYSNNLRSYKFIKDLKVLTNSFLNEKVIAGNEELPSEIYYDFQEGLEFYGQAYDLNNKLLSNTKIQLLVAAEGDAIAKEAITDDNGMFQISNLQIEGEADIVFRTVAEETKGKMVKVIPFEFEVPPISDAASSKEQRLAVRHNPSARDKGFAGKEEAQRLINLEGVTLVEKKIKKINKPSVYGIEPTRVTYQDIKRPKTIPQLFLGIPGVQVTGINDINPRLILPRSAGAGPVLWVLDGLPLIQPTSLNDIISLVPYLDIDRIEILFGAQASIYGTRAAGGAILVYTRSGDFDDYWNRMEAQLTFQGYHNSIDFDTYRNELPNRKRENSRVLYWNPSLSTDKNGEAIIRLKNVNTSGKIKIEATAISQDGKLGKRTKIF